MFGSKFWEEIFGEQILLNEIFFFFFFFLGGGGGGGGAKWRTISFYSKFSGEEIFGTKFWRRDSCEEEISPAKIFWRIFVSKISL